MNVSVVSKETGPPVAPKLQRAQKTAEQPKMALINEKENLRLGKGIIYDLLSAQRIPGVGYGGVVTN